MEEGGRRRREEEEEGEAGEGTTGGVECVLCTDLLVIDIILLHLPPKEYC